MSNANDVQEPKTDENPMTACEATPADGEPMPPPPTQTQLEEAQAYIQAQLAARDLEMKARATQAKRDRLYGLTAFIAAGIVCRDRISPAAETKVIADMALDLALEIVDRVNAHVDLVEGVKP